DSPLHSGSTGRHSWLYVIKVDAQHFHGFLDDHGSHDFCFGYAQVVGMSCNDVGLVLVEIHSDFLTNTFGIRVHDSVPMRLRQLRVCGCWSQHRADRTSEMSQTWCGLLFSPTV